MKYFTSTIFVVVFTLIFSEVALRIIRSSSSPMFPGNESGQGLQSLAMTKFVQKKIDSLWVKPLQDRKHIFEPPFDVFVNTGFDDPQRLNYINKYAKYPASSSYVVENFLRLNSKEPIEKYQVSINSFGYRGEEFTLKKAENTFRVLVLGSYPAFGHAVNDHETYAFELKKTLTNLKVTSKKIEILNAGKQGSTSIMGYVRLINDYDLLKPDLVIWDFGWIELYLGRDTVKKDGKRTELKKLTWFDYFVVKYCVNSFIDNLELCRFSMSKVSKVSYDDSIKGWRDSMDRLKLWSKQKKVPVIFLRHNGVTVPKAEYDKYHQPSDKFFFVDTSPSIEVFPTDEEFKEFWSKENWLSEIGIDKNKQRDSQPNLVFRGDAIQYNKLGYKRIAQFLAEEMIKLKIFN